MKIIYNEIMMSNAPYVCQAGGWQGSMGHKILCFIHQNLQMHEKHQEKMQTNHRNFADSALVFLKVIKF